MKRLLPLILAFSMQAAHAEGHGLAVPEFKKWKEECGSCHLAYPPKLLTADTWGRLMDGLDKHFGANATLEAKDKADILDFLKRYSATGSRFSSASFRISETPWFKREHRSVAPGEWSHPQVRSASNCEGCHRDVARNVWSEDTISMPGRGAKSREHGEHGGRDDDD